MVKRQTSSAIPSDSNEYLINTIQPKIEFKKFNRALCLLDPYALHLDWQVISTAGKSKAVDWILAALLAIRQISKKRC